MNKQIPVQFSTKNEKFINALKNAANNNQDFITYWCKPTDVSLNNQPNTDLRGQKIYITEIPSQRIIAAGTIKDIKIDLTEEIYKDSQVGGNKNLGLPANYDLDDWLWEINETLTPSEPYRSNNDIGGIYIKLDSLMINKHQIIRGNQAGRKYY